VRGLVLALALALATSGCDLFGPSGPGTLEAIVESNGQLGGLVLELTGPGIDGFEGRGGVQAYGTRVSASEERHRLVLVVPGPQPLRFGIRVADLGADLPTVRVVSAVTLENQVVLPTGVEIRLD